MSYHLEQALVPVDSIDDDEELADVVSLLNAQPMMTKDCVHVEPLSMQSTENKVNIIFAIWTPKLELKHLPKHLKYEFLRNSISHPVIGFASLTPLQEEKLQRILRKHKLSMGWTIANIRGLWPNVCIHMILLEGHKPSVEQ